MSFFFGVLILAVIVGLYFTYLKYKKGPINLDGCHAMVTGGSSGIGKSIAIELAKRGANISLLARDKNKLEIARKDILQHCLKLSQVVTCVSVDLSKDDLAIEGAVRMAEEKLGPVYILINNAGYGPAAKVEDTSMSTVRSMISLNLIGSLSITHYVLSKMKAQEKGKIVFVSSQAGLLGLYGYTAYSASKFGIRGYAEALQMEVKSYNIDVTVAFPPDTDTPGFCEDEKSMPKETRMISEISGLASAEIVAKSILEDSLAAKFLSTIGFTGWMLLNVCAGFSPSSLMEILIQSSTMGFLRIYVWCCHIYFQHVISKCKNTKRLNRKYQ